MYGIMGYTEGGMNTWMEDETFATEAEAEAFMEEHNMYDLAEETYGEEGYEIREI